MTAGPIGGLGELLFDPTADPDAVLVTAGSVSWTRGQVQAAARSVADRLVAIGVEPGQPVAVRLPTGPDVVAALFGVWQVGGAYLPVNPRLTDTEVERVIDQVRPAAMVDDLGAADGIRRVALDGGGGQPAHHEADIALIQFTSGTTGRPKAVLLRHSGVGELMDGVIGSIRGGGGSGTERPDKPAMPNLVPVSLSLWAGLYNVLFALKVGAAMVLLDPFSTTDFADLVHRYRIRSAVLPPAAMTMLTDDPAVTDLDPLRYVRSISAPLSPLQARRFRDRFGVAVLNCYGQTEIGGEIVGWTAADSRAFGEAKLGSVGRPHEGVAVRAVDPADPDGADVAGDEVGELWVRTPAMSAGYADGADLADRLSPDGWFRTGDMGRVDADGFVWIEGRVSDMINRGGLKVSPDEVAEVLRLSPGVADAAVVGAPDDRLGQVPVAFLVAGDGAEALARPSDDELEALAREHLAPYKVPVRFEWIDALPRNQVGKVLSGELVARTTPQR